MTTKTRRLYDASRIWKPQWGYPTPPGFRDEDFLVPFIFNVLANGRLQIGFPWKLDDDAPFFLRGLVFPQIGTGQQAPPALITSAPSFVNTFPVPALCRITDTSGNSLSPQSTLPVLALGAIAQSGFNSINAFGFPVEPEVEMAPGGNVIFDFLISTTGTPGLQVLEGTAEGILIEALVFGHVATPPTISLVDTGVPLTPLSVAVVGSDVTVTLQDDGGGALVTTYAQLNALINGTPAVAALMSSRIQGTNPAEILTTGVNAGPLSLQGNLPETVPIQGTMIGVKRFAAC